MNWGGGDENRVVGTQMTGNWKETEGPTIVAFKRRGWGEERVITQPQAGPREKITWWEEILILEVS